MSNLINEACRCNLRGSVYHLGNSCRTGEVSLTLEAGTSFPGPQTWGEREYEQLSTSQLDTDTRNGSRTDN